MLNTLSQNSRLRRLSLSPVTIMPIIFQAVHPSLNLPAVVDKVRSHPHYLGKQETAKTSVTVDLTCPYSSLSFADANSTGAQREEKVVFPMICFVQPDMTWLNTEGSWGKKGEPNITRGRPALVKDSSIKFHVSRVPDGVPEPLTSVRNDFSQCISTFDQLYKRCVAYFKHKGSEYRGPVSANKTQLNLSHKLFPVSIHFTPRSSNHLSSLVPAQITRRLRRRLWLLAGIARFRRA